MSGFPAVLQLQITEGFQLDLTGLDRSIPGVKLRRSDRQNSFPRFFENSGAGWTIFAVYMIFAVIISCTQGIDRLSGVGVRAFDISAGSTSTPPSPLRDPSKYSLTPLQLARCAGPGDTAPGCRPVDFDKCGNEPQGFRKQVDVGFDMLPGVGSANRHGMRTWWNEALGTYQVVNDTTAPRGGGVMQVLFPAGMPGGAGPPNSKFQLLQPDGSFFAHNAGNIYICFFIKRSANWSDNGNAGTKTFFVMPEPGTYPGPTISHFLSYNHEHKTAFCMEGTGLSRCFGSQNAVAEGAWHKLEYLWLAGTPGFRDGVVRHWVDGSLVAEAYDVLMFHSGQTPRYDWLIWDPTFGGGMNPVPHTQYIWLDHIYVSVK